MRSVGPSNKSGDRLRQRETDRRAEEKQRRREEEQRRREEATRAADERVEEAERAARRVWLRHAARKHPKSMDRSPSTVFTPTKYT